MDIRIFNLFMLVSEKVGILQTWENLAEFGRAIERLKKAGRFDVEDFNHLR